MVGNRFMWAAIVVVAGVLQGWDSGVLRSTALVQTLVALAIAAPAAALALTKNRGIQVATIAAAFVLLTLARILAPAPLPTLHLIAFVPTLFVLLATTTRRPTTGPFLA